MFRSALPRRERLLSRRKWRATPVFRSALPRRERRPPATRSSSAFRFRSALPRRERPQRHVDIAFTTAVSIRAPAKRATVARAVAKEHLCRFDPRSREESDRMLVGAIAELKGFDPRSREESDNCRHRPARWRCCFDPRSREESDGRLDMQCATIKSFDPRSREESDSIATRLTSELSVFRSALPRRERPSSQCLSFAALRFRSALPRRERRFPILAKLRPHCFDPRSREESDERECTGPRADRVSIRAPARRATLRRVDVAVGLIVSIRAPAKRATCRRHRKGYFQLFRSALPRRERPPMPGRRWPGSRFRSALPRRERRAI